MGPARPRKRFGQHFLHDQYVIKKIVDAIHPLPGEHIIEIGPGLGAMTKGVLAKCHRLDAIEIDRDIIKTLEEECAPLGELTLHNQDVLTFDFMAFGKANPPFRIIGNLPYNISTPILFHVLKAIEHITDMHFMLQEEVVDRLAANPGTKTYGRLSVMTQYFCDIQKLFTVAPGAFSPPPKVNSAIVRLTPHRTLPAVAKDFQCFERIVKDAFAQRRKTIRRSLRHLVPVEQWPSLQIDSNLRPECLTVAEFVRISNLEAQTDN